MLSEGNQAVQPSVICPPAKRRNVLGHRKLCRDFRQLRPKIHQHTTKWGPRGHEIAKLVNITPISLWFTVRK